ncbi:MAG: peptidoglycan editing factor PgeF [Leptolinea sp.]
MIRQRTNGLTYYQFESFLNYPLHQGVFTRSGGVSPTPWHSLNLGGLSSDSRENIIENRKRIFSCFDLPVESIYDVWQVHGNTVICTETARLLDEDHEKADAIFTNKIGITLFMRFADCVPLYFYDPVMQVVGLAHAGRIGTINRIAADCVKTMQEEYGSRAEDLLAAIGPSIGPDHYEVREDAIHQLEASFEKSEEFIIRSENSRIFLDLWKINQQILSECGVKQIEMAQICTACHTDEWFSHRAENGQTGRFGALLALQGEKS